tara:strand:- start:1104 stop:1925 length:822 start_codon:yes stop_codon:yes gene_type:complete
VGIFDWLFGKNDKKEEKKSIMDDYIKSLDGKELKDEIESKEFNDVLDDPNVELKIDTRDLKKSPVKSIDDLNVDPKIKEELKKQTLYVSEEGVLSKNKVIKNHPLKFDGEVNVGGGTIKWLFNEQNSRISLSCLDTNGKMVYKIDLKNDKLDGVIVFCDPDNSSVLSSMEYKNGKKDGVTMYYTKVDGEDIIYKEEHYSKNKLVEDYYHFPGIGQKGEFSKIKNLFSNTELDSELKTHKDVFDQLIPEIEPLNQHIETSINNLLNFYNENKKT